MGASVALSFCRGEAVLLCAFGRVRQRIVRSSIPKRRALLNSSHLVEGVDEFAPLEAPREVPLHRNYQVTFVGYVNETRPSGR